jgi:biotin operon repressor
MTELSPADEAILQYLRTQVDRLQDERYRQDARPSIANELFIAQRDLKKYTSDLRKKGYNI